MGRIKPGMLVQDENHVDILYAGVYTTRGGAVAEVIPIRGVKANDIALATRHTTTTRTIDTVACGKNLVTVTFSADPSTTHKINLIVFRNRKALAASRRVF
jgi:hypothetical protein